MAALTETTTRHTPGYGGAGWFNRSLAAVNVTPASSLQVAAVYAAVRVISQAVKGLPWRTYEQRQDGTRVEAPGHPVNSLLMRSAGPLMDARTWREQMLVSALLYGNGYAEIVRDPAGRSTELWFIHPERVTVYVDGAQLIYGVGGTDRGVTYLPSESVFHVKGLSLDGLVGVPVIHYAAETIGTAIASDEFTSAFLGNGAAPSGVLKHPQRLGPEAKKELRQDWQTLYGGSRNSGRVAVLESGLEYEAISIPQADAQFIEGRQFSVTEIARFFGVPPHKIADLTQAKWANIEAEQINFAQDSVMPWALRFEAEADRKLYRQPRYYSKMNLNGLMRGDSAARAEFYTKLFTVGALSSDEIRDLEDYNPVPGGKQHFIPLNLGTLTGAKKREEKANQPPPAPQPPPDPAANDDDGPPDNQVTAMARVLARCSRRESDRLARCKDDQARAKFLAEHRGYIRELVGNALDLAGFHPTPEAQARVADYALDRVTRIADADGDAAVIDNDADAWELLQ